MTPADPGLRGRPLVLVDDLDRPELGADDRHHFERVLRLASGAAVTLADGTGRWRAGRFGRELEPAGEVVEVPPPQPALTIAFVPVKGESPEWYAQKLTELGVDLPRVERLTPLADLVAAAHAEAGDHGVGAGGGLVLADPAGGPLGADHTTIVIGPEGGFAPAEAALAPTVALPGHILRAETAAVVAAALAVGRRAGLVGPPVVRPG